VEEDLSEIHLVMTIDSDNLSIFSQLLMQGFQVRASVGCSVKMFLCRELCLDPDYVDQRIQTIFLNSKAVDNLDKAIVTQGATLALSAAMPGLVGATFRKSGYYSSFRSHVSQQNNIKSSRHEGEVTIKLFNLIARDQGHIFLKRGIRISGKKFREFILQKKDAFRSAFKSISMDGKPVGQDTIESAKWENKAIFLRVHLKIS
jgi:hypothetical protein